MLARDFNLELDQAMHAGISRDEQVSAGLAAFFQIAEEWGLSVDEQRRLLGNIKRSRYFDLKKNPAPNLSDDELDRLAYLISIYTALHILYNEEGVQAWLTNPSEPGSIWRGQSPLAYLKSGKMMALIDVYRYLSGLRGAA